jgi:hypothetical protein
MQITNNFTSNSITASRNAANSPYLQSLEKRYGVSISVGHIRNQEQMKKYGLQCAASPNPFKNVKIAPNIARKMENDPNFANKYEAIIKNFSQTVEQKNQSFLNAHNWTSGNSSSKAEIWSSGIIIDENGEVQEWICGYITTEVDIKTPWNKEHEYISDNRNYNEFVDFREKVLEEYKSKLADFNVLA